MYIPSNGMSEWTSRMTQQHIEKQTCIINLDVCLHEHHQPSIRMSIKTNVNVNHPVFSMENKDQLRTCLGDGDPAPAWAPPPVPVDVATVWICDLNGKPVRPQSKFNPRIQSTIGQAMFDWLLLTWCLLKLGVLVRVDILQIQDIAVLCCVNHMTGWILGAQTLKTVGYLLIKTHVVK